MKKCLLQKKNIYAYKNKFSYKCDHIFIMYNIMECIYEKKSKYNLLFSFDRGLNYDPGVVCENAHPACDKKKQQENVLVFVKTLLVFTVDP